MTQTQTSPNATSRELEDRFGALNLENGAVGDEELEKFRKQWKDEVLKKRQPTTGAAAASNPANVGDGMDSRPAVKRNGKEPESALRRREHGSPERVKVEIEEQRSPLSPSARSYKSLSPSTSPRALKAPLKNADPSYHSGSLDGPSGSESVVPNTPKSPRNQLRALTTEYRGRRLGVQDMDAVSVYAKAVEAEQGGQLNDALNLYRQAFKMDDNVDRVYALNRAKAASKATDLEISLSSLDTVSAAPPASQPYSFQRTIQTAPDYDPHHPLSSSSISPNTRTSPLTRLIQSKSPSPAEAQFLPANEDLPVHLASLPEELLEHVMSHMDVAAIENFGSTCWKARFLTAHSEFWRVKAGKMYTRQAINPEGVRMADLGKKYGGEWRTCLIEQERVRMDGCYIAVCHYVRPGAGDEWVTITHMITYHRFLRFYPDGTVISFLTTDQPSEVVPILKPTLRGKGLHIGSYTLLPPHSDPSNPSDTTSTNTKPTNATNARGKHRILITDLLEPGVSGHKYEFEMELSLRETSRGKWNKLDILDYRSINLSNGEVLGLGLKHQKPFYFSKVRSYQPAL